MTGLAVAESNRYLIEKYSVAKFMKIHTLAYSPTTGWSAPEFPDLDSDRTLIFAFGASSYLANTEPFDELKAAFPTSTIVGCSTSGEIHSGELQDNSITVAIAKFTQTHFQVTYAKIDAITDSYLSGVGLAHRLDRRGLRCAFVLSDGMVVNGSELLRGLNSIFTDDVIVTGGFAGDGSRFSKTWVLKDGLPVSGKVCVLGFYGDQLIVGHGHDGGWSKFGPERLVTRSVGNVLYELDGRPALDIYRDYLGDKADGLPASALFFPLCVRPNEHDEKQLVRTVTAIDEEAKSMTFGGDVPQGSTAFLMFGNPDKLVDGAENASRLASPGEESVLGVAISCVARRRVLSEKTEDEIDAVLSALPQGSQLVGFYSYGEISPCCNGRSDLHNQTMALTTFSESA
jgi:hypothetical protein